MLVACMQPLPACPEPEPPMEPWIEGCQIAAECGLFEPEYDWVCHSCVKFWINIRTRKADDRSTLEKVHVGVQVMRAMTCDAISAEVEEMEIAACVRGHIANGAGEL